MRTARSPGPPTAKQTSRAPTRPENFPLTISYLKMSTKSLTSMTVNISAKCSQKSLLSP